jgi:hypothetical protein
MVVVAVIANGFLGDVRKVSMTYDLSFLARNCPAIPTEHRHEISEHILADAEFDGTLYIYEDDPASDTGKAFEAGFRGRMSEFLCAPGVGCLLPPELSADCTAAGT